MISIDKTTPQGFIFGASSSFGGRNVESRMALLSGLKPFPQMGDVIDLGAGHGAYAAKLVDGCRRLTLVDIDAHAMAGARAVFGDRPGVQYVVADAESTGLDGAAFDAAFLVEVLDHVGNPLAAMKEAARLLKPGGWLYVAVPNRAFPFECHPVRVGSRYFSPRWFPFLPWIPWLHRRLATARVFTRRELDVLAREVGFGDVRVDYLPPPFERHPYLRGISAALAVKPFRRFGVSICAAMKKNG